MNILNTILVFAVAFLSVFGEAALPGLRHLLGAQVDLLPVLMVYVALNANLTTVATLAIVGGLWFDTLSANPLGITILPLFAVGFVIFFIFFAARFDPARTVLRAGHPRHRRQRCRAGADRFIPAHRRQIAAARLGFALAMARDDGWRRGRDAGGFRAVRLVEPRLRLSATNRNQFPARPRNPAREKLKCSLLTN